MELLSEIKKSFPTIEKLFDESSWNKFMDTDYSNLSGYHFGLGTWIRNHILAENSNLLHLFLCVGINQKDDMSALIIQLFYIDKKSKNKAARN